MYIRRGVHTFRVKVTDWDKNRVRVRLKDRVGAYVRRENKEGARAEQSNLMYHLTPPI